MREILEGGQTAPTGWGKDPLTEYLDTYRNNQYATFASKRKAVVDLTKIDSMFVKFLKGAINPRPFVPMGFFLRAHSAYRAATGAVFAGQLYEAQALLRLCLEHGAYGYYIGADVERWERWMARNSSPAAKQLVRDEFAHGKVKGHINRHAKKLGNQYETLYDRLIDFGAHPNEQGFSLSTAIRNVDGDVHFDTIYLHDDRQLLNYGLKVTGQVGLWVLHIAQLVYPERFQIIGIRFEIEEIRKRY